MNDEITVSLYIVGYLKDFECEFQHFTVHYIFGPATSHIISSYLTQHTLLTDKTVNVILLYYISCFIEFYVRITVCNQSFKQAFATLIYYNWKN